jgi:hypothetical protein
VGASKEDIAALERTFTDALAALSQSQQDGMSAGSASGEGLVPTASPEAAGDSIRFTAEPSSAAWDAQISALRDQVQALSKLHESLLQALSDPAIPANFPTLELLRQSPKEQDWSKLQAILDEYARSGESIMAVTERFRWMSQEEILQTYGRPTEISESGVWTYARPNAAPGQFNNIDFIFVNDYVMQLRIM